MTGSRLLGRPAVTTVWLSRTGGPLSADARVKLERDGRVAPFAITFGVYGWMVHTCFFDSEVTASAAFDELMRRIEALCELIGTKGDMATFEKPDGVMSMDVEIATAIRSLVDDY